MTHHDAFRTQVLGLLDAARGDAELRGQLLSNPAAALAAAGIDASSFEGEDVTGYLKEDCWGGVSCFLLSTCVIWSI